jgi:glycosyltransferase involved in cell wall biosynthesis
VPAGVDLVIRARASSPWLEQSLLSALWQEERPARVVILDGGLSDRERDIVEELRHRLELRVVPLASGAVEWAVLAAARECASPLVAFLDAGDVCHPRRLRAQAEALRAAGQAADCVCAARVMDEDGLLGADRPGRAQRAPPRLEGDKGDEGGDVFSSRMIWRERFDVRGVSVHLDEPLVSVRARGARAPSWRRRAGGFAEPPPGPMPSLGVIIPARDMATTLPATLDSVAAQTLVPHAVVVVDDGSSDDTAALAARHPAVTRVVAGPRRGPSAARNAGIDACDTDVVVPCDADDLLEPDWLARAAGVFARRPHVGVVAGRSTAIDEDGRRLFPRPAPPGPWTAAALREHNTMTAHSGMALSRQAVLSAGGYDEELRFAEDWDLWQRLAASSTAVLCNAPAARGRLRAGSLVRSAHAEATLEPRLLRLGPGARARARAGVHLEVARVLLAHGAPDRAAALARTAVGLDPSAATWRSALPLLAGAALPNTWFRGLANLRREARRAGGWLQDWVLPAPWGER